MIAIRNRYSKDAVERRPEPPWKDRDEGLSATLIPRHIGRARPRAMPQEQLRSAM